MITEGWSSRVQTLLPYMWFLLVLVQHQKCCKEWVSRIYILFLEIFLCLSRLEIFKRTLSFVYHSLDPPLQPPTKDFLDLPCLAGKVDPNCMGLQVTWTLSFLWLTQLILVTFWQVPEKPLPCFSHSFRYRAQEKLTL